MPPRAKPESIDALVRSAIRPIAESTASALAALIASLAAERLEAELLRVTAQAGGARRRRAPSRRASRPAQLTRWVTDRRARRVPKFVIQMTGLDTKKRLVARFGANAVFEEGKPLPAVKGPSSTSSPAPARNPPAVKARPPIIRRAASAK